MHRGVLTTLVVMAASLMSIAGPGEGVSYGVVVVAFGDSTTATRLPYVPSVYADILRTQLPGVLGLPVTVVNAGIGGDDTNKAKARFNADVLSYHPDVVIVQFGLNDSWVNSQVEGNPSRVAIDTYAANLNYFVTTLKATGSDVILMTTNQTNTDPNAPPVTPLASSHWYPQWQEDLLSTYNDRVRNIARTQDVRLLDVWQMYSNYVADDPTHRNVNDLLVDHFEHPNQTSHTMVANGLITMIVPEPSSLALLLAAGLGLLAYMGRRK